MNLQAIKALKAAYNAAQPICDHRVKEAGERCACAKIFELLKKEEAKK